MAAFLTILSIATYAGFVYSIPPPQCFANFRWDDCGKTPKPVMYYWKPGSRCELGIWRGCLPNMNMFKDEYECVTTCVFAVRAGDEDFHQINADDGGEAAPIMDYDGQDFTPVSDISTLDNSTEPANVTTSPSAPDGEAPATDTGENASLPKSSEDKSEAESDKIITEGSETGNESDKIITEGSETGNESDEAIAEEDGAKTEHEEVTVESEG